MPGKRIINILSKEKNTYLGLCEELLEPLISQHLNEPWIQLGQLCYGQKELSSQKLKQSTTPNKYT